MLRPFQGNVGIAPGRGSIPLWSMVNCHHSPLRKSIRTGMTESCLELVHYGQCMHGMTTTIRPTGMCMGRPCCSWVWTRILANLARKARKLVPVYATEPLPTPGRSSDDVMWPLSHSRVGCNCACNSGFGVVLKTQHANPRGCCKSWQADMAAGNNILLVAHRGAGKSALIRSLRLETWHLDFSCNAVPAFVYGDTGARV